MKGKDLLDQLDIGHEISVQCPISPTRPTSPTRPKSPIRPTSKKICCLRLLSLIDCRTEVEVDMFWILISSLVASLAGLLGYLYYWKKGQFDDSEDVKYQMFREDE